MRMWSMKTNKHQEMMMKWHLPLSMSVTAVALQDVPNRHKRRCPRPAWTGLEHPGVVPGVPAHGWVLRTLPTQTPLGFCNTFSKGNKNQPQIPPTNPNSPCQVPTAPCSDRSAPEAAPAQFPLHSWPWGFCHPGCVWQLWGWHCWEQGRMVSAQHHFLFPHTEEKQKKTLQCCW